MRFSEMVSEADARLSAGSPEAFWQHMPDLFAQMLSSGAYRDALNEMLISIRDRNTAVTARQTSGQFIVFHLSQWSSWSLIYHKEPARFLYLSPVDALQSRVGGAELSVAKFGCDRPTSFDLLDKNLELREEGCFAAPLNTTFSRRGREEILDWSCASGHFGPGVTLRVNSSHLADFEWSFDRSTCRPVGLTPLDPVESNLTTVFSLLSAVGERSSVEHLIPFLRSDRHFIRWKAMQAIGALDSDQCAVGLQELADDPHEEVRRAARKSLESFSIATVL